MKSPRRRKLISARCFYIFLLSNILLEEIKRSFPWSGLDLSNINQERKSTFDQFQKAVQRMFLSRLWRTSEWANSKIEILFLNLTYRKAYEHKKSFAACGVIRGPGFLTLIFDIASVQKRAFCSFDYWELKKFSFNVFPETNVVLFTCYQG